MSQREILMAFKSSLDMIIKDLAEELSAAVSGAQPVFAFDLDDPEGMRQIQAGSEHSLVYQYITMPADPRHPLYSVQFLAGAKTTADPGNYDMTTLLGDLSNLFTEGSSFELYDYSDVAEGEEPGELLGTLIILSCVPAQQMFENQSGIRMMQISGKVMAYGLG